MKLVLRERAENLWGLWASAAITQVHVTTQGYCVKWEKKNKVRIPGNTKTKKGKQQRGLRKIAVEEQKVEDILEAERIVSRGEWSSLSTGKEGLKKKKKKKETKSLDLAQGKKTMMTLPKPFLEWRRRLKGTPVVEREAWCGEVGSGGAKS